MKNKKIKIVCLYQVVMHYRLPFYENIIRDEDFDFLLLYGRGKKRTKLINTDISTIKMYSKKLYDFRIPFKTNNGEGSIPFTPFLFWKLIISNPDVVFSEGTSSIINSSIAFIYAKMFKKKFVWWSLGKLEDRKYSGIRSFLSKWEKLIELNSDAIFTYSTQGKKYFLQRGITEDKIFVAVNVLDTNKKINEIKTCKEKIDFPFEDYFNIAFIGSLTKEKNLELLVDVMEDFNKKYNNIGKVHIIGDGIYFNSLTEYVNDKKMIKDVVFYGRINKGASKILKYCNLMVLPGLGGLAICEGMLNSLPIITGKADGTELDLINDENGYVLSEISSKKLFNKIEFMYLNPDIRKRMGNESYRKITEEYSFNNYYSIFKDCINFVTQS